MDKKSSMMKDAIILCAITLILGAVLAGVYMLTKDPIDNAQKKQITKPALLLWHRVIP